ncbi:MAG: BrxA/BrxB family bacilliredoxin [Chlorobi bacterium]|nr:BrxA/BrxB family bacilliredoxin [Chlorobiota bacterium]
MGYYPEEIVEPMRQDILIAGFEDLRTPEEVDKFMEKSKGSTAVIFVNSVCGCAAGAARPGLKIALQQAHKKPEFLGTVFAGADIEATTKAREYMQPFPPSSPSLALFKNGQLVWFMPRYEIEGRTPEELAEVITQAFETFC